MSLLGYIGCRTTKERNARGEGITLVSINPQDGSLDLIEVTKNLINPSFLAVDGANRILYTVHGDKSEASSFRIAENGSISLINTGSTYGNNPVHIAIAPDRKHLLVSNHLSSSVALLSINNDGSIGELKQLIQLAGETGPHKFEQPFAKPHFNPFSPCGQFVVIPDKGLDAVFTIPFRDGVLVEKEITKNQTRECAGPRNAIFHPNGSFVYVVNELDSTVTAYKIDQDTFSLSAVQILSCLEDSFTKNSRASGIKISSSGKTLYASNRGSDSIAVFTIDQQTGTMAKRQIIKTGGLTPRFITLDPSGKWLFSLNEDSDSISTFEVDPGTGELSSTRHFFHTGSPVCMVFFDQNIR